MKKVLLSSFLALGIYANAQCDPITTFPKYYNFEDVTTPALPACWTVTSSGNGNDWNTWAADGNYGTTAGDQLLSNSLPANAVGTAWLFTQAFSLNAGEKYSVAYTSWATNSTNSRILSVAYGTTASDAGMNIFGTDASVNETHETNTFEFTPSTTGTYYIGLRAHNTVADSKFASVLVDNFTVKKVDLAVSDINSNSKIKVYPNPVKDVLKISDTKGVKSISVTDMSGRQVKTLAPSSEIDLSNLKAGNYMVSLTMENGSVQNIQTIKN